METRNLIQTQANVIKITKLTKGNVVKIIDSEAYGGDKIKYGVVLELFNDGEKTFIEMLEYTKNYSNVSSAVKIYKGSDDLSLFPTTIGEVEDYFGAAINCLESTIVDKKEELLKLENGLKKAMEFTNGELSKKLSEVSFAELTQERYKEEKELKESKLKELQAE